jgi:hypothetical protein
MQNKDILGTNENIEMLCDWIDECYALNNLWYGYVNDPVDLDRERCFV